MDSSPSIRTGIKMKGSERHASTSLAPRGRSSSIAARARGQRRPVRFLNGLGFKKAKNLMGGVKAWGIEVDPTIQTF
jgi:hypothetical protein